MWQMKWSSDILVHRSGFPPLGFCCGDKNYKGKTTFFVLKTHQIIARANKRKKPACSAGFFRFGQSGFEPPTPWSRTRCASPCATTRKSLVYYMVFGFHCQQEEWAEEHQSFIDIILHIMIFL